jgi:hypothetical protein
MVGRRNDASGDVKGDVILSVIDGKGSEPENESTLTERCVLIGMSLTPNVEGGRSSMGK